MWEREWEVEKGVFLDHRRENSISGCGRQPSTGCVCVTGFCCENIQLNASF